jgi:hypothetical protein
MIHSANDEWGVYQRVYSFEEALAEYGTTDGDEIHEREHWRLGNRWRVISLSVVVLKDHQLIIVYERDA